VFSYNYVSYTADGRDELTPLASWVLWDELNGLGANIFVLLFPK